MIEPIPSEENVEPKPTSTQRSTGPQNENKSAKDFLTPDLQELLNKELALLDKDRSGELNLLKKGVATESKFLKDWGFPTDCTYEECQPEEISNATTWLKKKQCDLEEEINGLTGKKEQKQNEIKTKEEEITRLENELKTLLDQLKAMPDEAKNARELVKTLQAEYDAAPPDSVRRELIKAELDAAKSKLKRLCGTEDPNADCQPDFENKLHRAIGEVLTAWRTARKDLRNMVAGPEKSLEAIEVDIKKISKELEYTKTYSDVLIANYLDCGKCA